MPYQLAVFGYDSHRLDCRQAQAREQQLAMFWVSVPCCRLDHNRCDRAQPPEADSRKAPTANGRPHPSYRTARNERSPSGYCQDYAISVVFPMKFAWDEAKHARTLRERGVGFDDAARIFAKPVLIWRDSRRDCGEDRFRAVGETDGDIPHVAFTWRGDVVRIISVQRASRKEVQLWRSHR